MQQRVPMTANDATMKVINGIHIFSVLKPLLESLKFIFILNIIELMLLLIHIWLQYKLQI